MLRKKHTNLSLYVFYMISLLTRLIINIINFMYFVEWYSNNIDLYDWSR